MTAKTKSRVEHFAGLAKLEGAAYEGKTNVAAHGHYEVRRVWHDGEWWFSVADVVGALVESKGRDASAYWRKLKQRLGAKEGAEQVVTDCHELKLPAADGRMRATDCANVQTLLRIVQSVSSPRAEPIKQFLAQAGAEKLEEIARPTERTEKLIQRYRRQGRLDRWIDIRMLNISMRHELTDQWARRGVDGPKIGAVTAEMHKEVFDLSPAEHRDLKGLKSQEPRDHMDEMELTLVTLSEQAPKAFIVERDTRAFGPTREASLDGAKVAGNAAREIQVKLGRAVANPNNFLPKPEAAAASLESPAKPKIDDPG